MTLTDEQISELRAKAEAATPGKFASGGDCVYACKPYRGICKNVEDAPANMEYIAAACNSVRSLLDEVERLRRENTTLLNRVSPSETCHCPEFCQYHARQVFEHMKTYAPVMLGEIIRIVGSGNENAPA